MGHGYGCSVHFTKMPQADGLDALLKLPYLGGVIEWGYVGVLMGLTYLRFFIASEVGQLGGPWGLWVITSLVGVAICYIFLIGSCDIPVARFWNMVYHTVWAFAAHAAIGTTNLVPWFHALLIIPFVLLIIIFVIAHDIFDGAMRDWHYYKHPELRHPQPSAPLEMPEESSDTE